MQVEIEPMTEADWHAVAEIYGQGIEAGEATFETAVPDYAEWDGGHLAEPRLVARLDGAVVGWAALAPVSDRCVYGGVAEDSVYVARQAVGRGVGRMLLDELVHKAEEAGIWTVQAGIFPENTASLAVHERCGLPRRGTPRAARSPSRRLARRHPRRTPK